MGIAVLGPLTLDGSDDVLGRRDRVVLAALAVHPGDVLSADQLADALWGDHVPASWSKVVQGCVVRLRKLLGAHAIETSPSGYRLTVSFDEIDAQRFERAVVRARQLLQSDDAERAAYVLADALALWRGRPWPDLDSWDVARIDSARLEDLRLEAEELYVEANIRCGHHDQVLAKARALVSEGPLRERRWSLLALAQYQAGQQSDALATLRRVRDVLGNELGLDPGTELAELEEAILRQDPSLVASTALPEPAADCPYPGLMAYDIDDADAFFGREADVDACLRRLASSSLLTVVGYSGSGKSSLIRAGIAAALRRDGRLVTVLTPGAHPMDVLASSSLEPRSILLVDQCEEVFSLCKDPAERVRFLDALVSRAATGSMVLAMRADRLGEVAAHPGFARLVERGLYLLTPMAEGDLRAAVEGPARHAGLVLEAGLVDLLIGEVAEQPGALPLLSHALRETWHRREGRTLTVAGYRATGGIKGAVSKSAEHVYAQVGVDGQVLLRDLLLRLVAPGAEGEPVRSRLPRRLVVTDQEHEAMVDLLVGSRLVTSDDGVLELAHEALASAWPRLRGWLDDDIEGQRTLHHLAVTADAWEALGRPDSELYRGVRLTRALQWRARGDTSMTGTEIAFLQQSERNEQSEQRAAEQQARDQATLIRRLRGVLAGATVLLLVALVAGGLAVQQKGNAEDSAAAALTAKTASDARNVSARALATDDIDTSMLLAVAGVQLDDSPESRSSLLAALAKHPALTASTQMTGGEVIHLDVSPDGRKVATYDTANHVRLYAIDSGELLAEFQAGPQQRLAWQSGQVRFSPDGRTLAVAMAAPSRQPVMLLHADNLEPLPEQLGGLPPWRWEFLDLAFSADGEHLATTVWRVQGTGRNIRTTTTWALAWELRSPRSTTARIRLEDDNPGVALGPDGSVMYTTLPLTIHDLRTGESRAVADPERVERVTMSPDGRLLVGPGRGGLLVLDPATGEIRRRLRGNGDIGWFVNFSGDGSRVGTITFNNREALVWDVSTGALQARIPLEEGGESLDFGAGHSTLYTAGSGSSLRRWDVDGDSRFIAQVAFAPEDISDLSFVHPAPGGDFVAFPSGDQLRFLDVDANTVSEPLYRGQGYRAHAGRGGSWHPDGVHYALATGGDVMVWTADTGELMVKGHPRGDYVSGIDYSTDGSRLVVGELSGRVSMLDPTTLSVVGRPVQLPAPVCCVSAGPDNRSAVALTGFHDASGFWVGSSSRWVLVDLDSGSVLDEGALSVDGTVVAYSPDGRHAAIGGGAGDVLVLDLRTGEPVRSAVVAHDWVGSVTYSQDGDEFLTSGADSAVGLWGGDTGRLLARVETPHRFTEAAFLEDPSSVLIAPLWGGAVYRWDTPIDDAVAFACRVAGRDFTAAEWTEHLGSRPHQTVCRS